MVLIKGKALDTMKAAFFAMWTVSPCLTGCTCPGGGWSGALPPIRLAFFTELRVRSSSPRSWINSSALDYSFTPHRKQDQNIRWVPGVEFRTSE